MIISTRLCFGFVFWQLFQYVVELQQSRITHVVCIILGLYWIYIFYVVSRDKFHCDDVKMSDCLLNRLFRRRSRKHLSSASLAFVRGIHRWPVNSPLKGPVTRKIFPLDDVIIMYSSLWNLSCEYILWKFPSYTELKVWYSRWVLVQFISIESNKNMDVSSNIQNGSIF